MIELVNQTRTLIQKRLGLDIERRTTVDLAAVLQQIAREQGRTYLHKLRIEPTTAPAWQRLIHELTLGETYFFRNQAQFRLLRDHILPQFAQQPQSLNIWCVGCATGEEAYSVAITVYETLPDTRHVTILGTDISARALETARRGVYRDWSFRHRDTRMMTTYFRPVNDRYQIRDDIRELVTFRQHNLLEMTSQPWAHVILCRNVLLYFSEDAKKHAEHILERALHPGGWLLLGHAEAIHQQQLQTHMIAGTLVYHKPTTSGDSQTLTPRADEPLKLTGTLSAEAPPAPEARYAQAVEAFQAGQYDTAESILADILTSNPTNSQTRIMLAAIFANRGAITEAHAHLNTALQSAPLNPDAHYLRAMLYLEENDTHKADVALRAALYSQTGHPLAALMLGNLRAQEGELQRARNLWEQALDRARQLPPDQPISDFNLRTAADFAALVHSQIMANS